MKKYLISEKKIIIYGAGSVAKVVSNLLKSHGMTIAAYVDQRAEWVRENEGIPVISLEQAREYTEDKDDYAIIITIRNVFEHSQIANQFFDLGYNNIIYKPISVLRGKGEDVQKSISQAYEEITAQFHIPDDYIACYCKEQLPMTDEAIKARLDKLLLVYLPAEMLFSNVNDKIPVWSRQNFVSNYIAVDLYRAFANAGSAECIENVNRYVDEFALPGAKTMGVNTDGNWRELLIDARQKVYSNMDYNLNINPDFFEKNSTTVKYCKSEGFELIASGKNRVSFLIAKGYRYIPVKIAEEDYNCYLNLDVATQLYKYLQEQKIYETFAPIPHPYFYKFPTIAENYVSAFIAKIAHNIAQRIYSERGKFSCTDCSISIFVNDEGYAGRYFKMLGYRVERYLSKKQELCQYLDELFYFEENSFQFIEESCQYSIISSDIAIPDVLPIIKKTQSVCFFIKIGNENGTEEILEAENFRKKDSFMKTIWNGKIVEAFIFER